MPSVRQILFVLLCATALLGSFFITLWLTEPQSSAPPAAPRDPSAAAEDLGRQRVASLADLANAARAAGLHVSKRLQGNVDAIARASERDVTLVGWLADPDGDSTPLSVSVFVGGKRAGATLTKGQRPDVTQGLHLAFGAEQNVAFTLTTPCASGEQPIVVGIGIENQYRGLETGRCP
jgi:hypothetical protein